MALAGGRRWDQNLRPVGALVPCCLIVPTDKKPTPNNRPPHPLSCPNAGRCQPAIDSDHPTKCPGRCGPHGSGAGQLPPDLARGAHRLAGQRQLHGRHRPPSPSERSGGVPPPKIQTFRTQPCGHLVGASLPCADPQEAVRPGDGPAGFEPKRLDRPRQRSAEARRPGRRAGTGLAGLQPAHPDFTANHPHGRSHAGGRRRRRCRGLP